MNLILVASCRFVRSDTSDLQHCKNEITMGESCRNAGGNCRFPSPLYLFHLIKWVIELLARHLICVAS